MIERFPDRATCLATVLAVMAVLWPAAASAANRGNLSVIADGFRWPHVSSRISYRGRLWFANSRKYVNHNSADIWSYDPAAGATRYERHLFSQDAGDPVVHSGLLYWPFEDPRFSGGRGEFMVTNGTDWRWCLLPEGRAFHVHAMASLGERRFAATSAWVARLQESAADGAPWRVRYEHPTPERNVSRITALQVLDGMLYGGLTAWYRSPGAKLLRWTGATFEAVPGWPEGNAVPRLAAYRGWLYGQNVGSEANVSPLWRTAGRRVEPVTGFPQTPVRGIAAGPDALWVATGGDTGGLWRSADGTTWSLVQQFPDTALHGIAVHGGRVYAGGERNGRGVLLGDRRRAALVASPSPPALPVDRRDGPESTGALAAVREALADASGYDQTLRPHFLDLALNGTAADGAALSRMLDGPFPDGEETMFGNRRFPAAKMARWYLMWTIAHIGSGRVPPALLRAPWEAPVNRAEKYFEPPPGAAWAVSILRQSDEKTISALIDRLHRAGDPDWVNGDVVGALSVLTGERFGYDAAAWRDWWMARSRGG